MFENRDARSDVGSIDNIYLLGFMGAGKSTVGPALAHKIHWEFIDMDSVIVSRAGMPISEIFQKFGEPFFRNCESELLIELSRQKHQVISLGGGTFFRPENQEVALSTGSCIYLEAKIETLVARLSKDDPQVRPLLKDCLSDESLTRRVTELLEPRRLVYEKAQFTVETDQKEVSQIIEEINRLLRLF